MPLNKCAWCGKEIKMFAYWPYCSFHCQEWGELHKNKLEIDRLQRKDKEVQDD